MTTAIPTTIQNIPLNALVPSTANVRRTDTTAGVEELVASIAAHGLLQNLTVRRMPPVARKAAQYEVIAGGRRLNALKLLATRKALAKDAPIPCQVMPEGGIAEELSLAENALQAPMHPADQYEAFAKLHAEYGMSAEDIAARFGVTPAVVKQRLKLGAVSPALMTIYRAGEMNLDQLTAFTITDDHGAQERAWKALGWDDSRRAILGLLSEGKVATSDRRALFVGIEAYQAAGGAVLRDLFDAAGGGFLSDAALLDRLACDKLEAAADTVRTEGWRWVVVARDFDYSLTADMRRIYPEPTRLDTASEARLAELEAQRDALCDREDGEWAAIAGEVQALDRAIAALQGEALFQPGDIARAGAFVCLGRDGELRIERGFVRKGDLAQSGAAKAAVSGDDDAATPAAGGGRLSAGLVRELTAYRTIALRRAIGDNPAVALTAVVHALAAATFVRHGTTEASCLDLSSRSAPLTGHAKAIDDSVAGQAVVNRHATWERRILAHADALWDFVAALPQSEQLALLAHCASLAIDAVDQGTPQTRLRREHAQQISQALCLDLTTTWTATAASYFSRVSKAQIVEAVREGVSDTVADDLADLKKGDLAAAAEQRLAGRGWLPELLRTHVP